MDTLILILLASIFTNMLLFRWGHAQRTHRKQLQNEVTALSEVLRRSSARPVPPKSQGGGFLVVAFLFLGLILALLFVSAP